MMKKIFGFLFLGALIVGCACDIQCFIDKQMEEFRLGISSLKPGLDICSNLKKSFDDLRSDIKMCSVTKISVDKLEAFTDEICHDNGTLRKSAIAHAECFQTEGQKAQVCFGEVGIQLKFEDIDKPLEIIKSVCEKISDIYSCLNLKFQNLCGEDAGMLAQNLTSALSTYTSGLCEEVNGASLNQVVYMNIFLGLLCVLLMWHKD